MRETSTSERETTSERDNERLRERDRGNKTMSRERYSETVTQREQARGAAEE